MVRFKLGFNVGTNFNIDEDTIHDKQCKIIDNLEELPDLEINSHEVGREYVRYMNKPVQEKKIEHLISEINNNLSELNHLNYELIKPNRYQYIDEETGEERYQYKLEDNIFITGYTTISQRYIQNIILNLEELKKLLTEK